MNKSETIGKLATALKNFQSEVGNVPKDAVNPFFKSKYASLESVVETVKPILAKHGLSYSQFPSQGFAPDIPALTTVLMHESGEWLEAIAPLLIKDHTPQGQGSAITYMRRYALSAVLGIATEDDDDGNAATAPKAATKPVVATKTVPPKSVLIEQKKAEIKKLCDEKSEVPLLDKKGYAEYVLSQTGLALEEGNLDPIIERLKAL